MATPAARGAREPTRNVGARIVVAEDDPDLRELLREALELDGATVVDVPDGAALVEYVTNAGKVDLIVTDMRMPRRSGLDALAALRAIHIYIPALVVTGFGDAEVVARAERLGAIGVLEKPFDLDDLRLIVQLLLGR